MEKIATAVISSKVKGVTSDISKGLGLDEDSGAERAEREQYLAKEQVRRDRELEKRKKEREKEREQRDKERQAIRDKYQLPAKGSGAGSTSSASRHQASPEDKDKCVIS